MLKDTKMTYVNNRNQNLAEEGFVFSMTWIKQRREFFLPILTYTVINQLHVKTIMLGIAALVLLTGRTFFK